ncbi:hypothetical protein UFOVP257_311 [uncultured Caudovirales phage]|uniref:Uncharacterized protein n=1 Tax=uncultured Caudovirales phage TaxID=2100421 RepID=A0A6J5LPC7_9CAUD|nr:hypothetical protein UFOVP257_311 [uncultured Caudovirales phage]
MHPLVSDLSGLSNEELHKKHADLLTKYNQAFRFGPSSVIPQMQMILENYNSEIANRNRKLAEEMDKKSEKYKGTIDIQ